MNKLKINIDKVKKIITVDILGVLDAFNVSDYDKQLEEVFDRIETVEEQDMEEWRINIYTCHLILGEHAAHIEQLLDTCMAQNPKMLDIIVQKPQKKYKEWLAEIVSRRHSDKDIKVLVTNNMPKF